MTTQKVELGDEVKDTVTGFQGIATSYTTALHGCARVGVQPPVDKDGKIPDGYSVDEPQCIVIKKGAVPVPEFEPEVITVQLGDEVIDPVTKFTGIVDSQTRFMNGCVRMGVIPTIDKDGKFREGRGFDAPRLQLVKSKQAETSTKEKRTGGPMGPLPARF